ncbi:MAG: UPF0182 family protein [Planctomycetota bacterium]|jgi:uncharacterized membrane protein (UPF0182 family)
MYVALLLTLTAVGVLLLAKGVYGESRRRTIAGAGVLLFTLLFFCLLSFWAEMLWFDAVGQSSRFWTVVWTTVGAVFAGAALALIVVGSLTWPFRPHRRAVRLVAGVLAVAVGGIWGLSSWQEILLFLHRVPTGTTEPILEKDTGFYLFVLPLLDRVYRLLLLSVGLGLAATLVSTFAWKRSERPPVAMAPYLLLSAAFALVLAGGRILRTYHLLYSDWGVVAGPGWTDVHIRLPAYRIVALLTLLVGAAPLLKSVRRRFDRWAARLEGLPEGLAAAVGSWALIAAIWVVAQGAVPALTQWLVVEPNEITFEKAYIRNNIRFTRRGFALHDVEERQFPAAERFTEEMARRNRHLLSDVRLWDWRALDAVYKQFQEIRLYYEFLDVDIDRYTIGDQYRQVMVSARELNQENLPRQSQTFVNRRFKYTHGYGLTLATVSDFTPDGLPNLLLKDIPPRATVPELKVTRPEIYYGQATGDPAVAHTKEKEFDYPSGETNVYIQYPGSGGVHLKNLWRKFVFGWKFDGTRFFFSTYPDPGTRIMFHRKVRERVRTLAPFLEFDSDPYIVLVDGRLHWILDAYTTSRYYPYSEPFAAVESIEFREGEERRVLRKGVAPYLRGANYVRNSVKAVVDAFDGSVDLYVFEPDDPLVRAWRGAFPGLFMDKEKMPAGLRAHVRYPVDFLLAQGLVYAKYHMGDPEVFYNQEDLWVRATEKYYAAVQPVEPYYVMWQQPGAGRAEFVLILPFTPKNRQVLIGWIAGMCDGENYGRFLAYKFPKEKRVLGPQQVETKIDQDRFLSGQLTLWDQRGSNVIRGNVLAIPIEGTLLYVEPIYLQAETAAYPELRLVVVMQGDRMNYAETFEEALRGLLAGRPREAPEIPEESVKELARQANEAFTRYLELQAEQRFEEAARELKRLRDLLHQLADR